MADSGPRQTQHRPSSEAARGRELAQAKRKIKELTRQVARLQRRLEKYESMEPLEESPAPTLSDSEGEAGIVTGSGAPQQNPEPKPDPNICPCGAADFTEMDTPTGKKIRICKACKDRKVVSL